MEISIGIMAYNEERNITLLLNELIKQELDKVKIKEIIIVNDGSTDNTLKLVKQVKDSRIKLVNHPERMGKYQAINTFLKEAKSDILVLESADNLPRKDAIEKLVRNFEDSSVGVVASNIAPLNKKGLWGKFGLYIYYLHNQISRNQPKYGELIAFRNTIKEIPSTSADEEMIAKLVMDKGFIGVYEPNSIVYIKTPCSLREILKQRRRIHCGHVELNEKYSYKASSYNKKNVFKPWLRSFKEYNPILIIFATSIEILSRGLGIYDYITNKEKHYKWEMIDSIKKVK